MEAIEKVRGDLLGVLVAVIVGIVSIVKFGNLIAGFTLLGFAGVITATNENLRELFLKALKNALGKGKKEQNITNSPRATSQVSEGDSYAAGRDVIRAGRDVIIQKNK